MTGTEEEDPLVGIEDKWREWASSESAISDDHLRSTLPVRLPPRRKRRLRFALLAAAASLALVLVGVRVQYFPSNPDDLSQLEGQPSVVHQLDENVVLLISKDTEPLYIVLADIPAGKGDSS